MTETNKKEAKPSLLEKDEAEVRALNQHANGLLLRLDALLETANRIMLILTKSRERASKELLQYVGSLPQPTPNKKLILSSNSAEYRCFLKYSKARAKANQASRIVPQSFLVSMVSQYDAFSVAMLKSLFLLKPEKIRTADRTVTVKELVSFDSIQEVLQSLIEDEIEDVLRDSHTNQIQWIGKKFDFKIDGKDQLVERFIEITERRNLYVHAEGVVSKQYLLRVGDLKSVADSLPSVGETLLIDRLYITETRNTLFELAIRMLQLAWRKIRPDHSEHQNTFINAIIFELLTREDFTLARNIGDFASDLRGITDETYRRLMCINRAQAYKWSDKSDEARKIVDELDWGASAANFKLAVAVIRDEFDNVLKIMQDVPRDGRDGISAEDYRSWPLFRELRNRLDFQSSFRSRFGEDLVQKDIDIQSALYGIDEGQEDLQAEQPANVKPERALQSPELKSISRSVKAKLPHPAKKPSDFVNTGSARKTIAPVILSNSTSSKAATAKSKLRKKPAKSSSTQR